MSTPRASPSAPEMAPLPPDSDGMWDDAGVVQGTSLNGAMGVLPGACWTAVLHAHSLCLLPEPGRCSVGAIICNDLCWAVTMVLVLQHRSCFRPILAGVGKGWSSFCWKLQSY